MDRSSCHNIQDLLLIPASEIMKRGYLAFSYAFSMLFTLGLLTVSLAPEKNKIYSFLFNK